jgi:hypothetical protein
MGHGQDFSMQLSLILGLSRMRAKRLAARSCQWSSVLFPYVCESSLFKSACTVASRSGCEMSVSPYSAGVHFDISAIRLSDKVGLNQVLS